jgi:Tol biopolymer transport system component
VVELREAFHNIWIYDLGRGTLSRLTFEGGGHAPHLTPDGQRVIFGSDRVGQFGMFWKPADATGPEERLTTSGQIQYCPSLTPDGKLLVFDDGEDIWMLRMEGDRKPRPFLQTRFQEGWARLSPDGRWLVYRSNETGRHEVYVQPFPGHGEKWPISTEGGHEPIWARSGREIFYRHGDKMMAVAITTQPRFTAGQPRVLFEGAYAYGVSLVANYDVTADGQRFIMVKSGEKLAPVTQINLVLNWFEELKRRVPTARK